VGCVKQRVYLGARNLRIVFQFVERNAAGKLIAVDLTAAATSPGYVQALFRKPSREVVLVTCTVDSPPTDGLASYYTSPGFLDEHGDWEAQGLAHLAGAPAPGRGFFPAAPVLFEVVALLRPFAPLEPIEPEAGDLELALPTVSVL